MYIRKIKFFLYNKGYLFKFLFLFAAEDENGECDWMIGCENQEHLNDLIEKVQSELKILNFKDYSKEKDLTMS